MVEDKNYVPIDEAAERLNIDRWFIVQCIQAGYLQDLKGRVEDWDGSNVSWKRVRVELNQLLELLKSRGWTYQEPKSPREPKPRRGSSIEYG